MCSHLRQLWNLNQPLEILQVTGAIEQTLYPAGEKKEVSASMEVVGQSSQLRTQRLCRTF